MAEVEVIKLLGETNKILLGKKNQNFIFPLPSVATLEKLKIEQNSLELASTIDDGKIVEFSVKNRFAIIEKIFESTLHDEEVASVLFLNNIDEKWNEDI